MVKHNDTEEAESLELCEICNLNAAYKTDGNSRLVCFNYATFWNCHFTTPRHLPATKDATMQGRNDICLCGSGKKFKHCCIHETPARRLVFSANNSMPVISNEQAIAAINSQP